MRHYFMKFPYSESLFHTSNHTPGCPRTLTLGTKVHERISHAVAHR